MKICPKCFFPFLLTSTKFAYANNLKKRLILICNMCMEWMYGIQVLKIDCLYTLHGMDVWDPISINPFFRHHLLLSSFRGKRLQASQ